MPHAPITKEERDQLRKDMPRRLEMIGKARAAIIATKLSHGVIECPNCKGKLGFSVARSNGHVHAHCETRLCVSWME